MQKLVSVLPLFLPTLLPLVYLGMAVAGFPGSSVVKNPPSNAGDVRDGGSIPGSGNGNPLQYSYMGNPVDRGRRDADSNALKDWMPENMEFFSSND